MWEEENDKSKPPVQRSWGRGREEGGARRLEESTEGVARVTGPH